MPGVPPPPNSSPSQPNSLLPQGPSSNLIAPPRADFEQIRYDQILAQHGVDVLFEKALQCPCKSEQINALSSCLNCGGTGWFFVNPKQERMVLQGVGYKKLEEMWSSIMDGVVTISYPPEIKLSYLDRITRLNAESIFSEVIDFNEKSNQVFGFTTYAPKEIEYVGLYQSDAQKLLPLSKDQYTIQGQKLTLIGVDLPYFNKIETPLTATIRYIHAPVFHVTSIDRESLDNMKWQGGGEVIQYLPGKAIGKRVHNITDLEKRRNGQLFDNSYTDSCDCC